MREAWPIAVISLVWMAGVVPSRSGAQSTASGQQAVSLGVAIRMVSGDVFTDEQVLALARRNCIGFQVDSVVRRQLSEAGGGQALLTGLASACYLGTSVAVTSLPEGAEVRIRGRLVGVTPYTGPVPGGVELEVEVRRSGLSSIRRVSVPTGRLLEMSFSVQDTVPVPPEPTREELEAIESGRAIRPLTNLPKPPERPKPLGPRNPVVPWLLGAAVGGGAAFALGQRRCTYENATFGPTQNGYQPYTGVEELKDGACLAATAAGGLGVGSLVADLWSRRGYRGRRMRHEQEVATFDQRLAAANQQRQQQQEQWTRENDGRLIVLRQARDAWMRAVERNRQVREANARQAEVKESAPRKIVMGGMEQ